MMFLFIQIWYWAFIIWVAVIIADFIRAILWQKKIKRQQIRMDFRHAEMLEAWTKLEIAIKNSKIDTAEMHSMKRHIRTLLDRLDEVEVKLDDQLEQYKTVEQSPTFEHDMVLDGYKSILEDDENE